MTAPAVGMRLEWKTATVEKVVEETSRTRSLILSVPRWPGHRAGQHVDVRLTADDGYQAERSYSIASAPEDEKLALTVEKLEDGEVSSYLCGELRVGDVFEVRGPIGGYFVWNAKDGGPLLLIAGGSGIVPLMAMLRHRAATRASVPTRLLYSSRRWDDVIYRDELVTLSKNDRALQVTHTITREVPRGWKGYHRRVDRAMLSETAWPAGERPRVYVCGPTPFVESVANELVALGHDASLVKTERFGPTGS
ncbi:MAG TPA: ferredoxin reductase [Gemmatimonadaceae bacterium]|nr:ferredoxin reductase [Gemmatimonadaceae bacterium]